MTEYILLKTWDEIAEDYPPFINEDNFGNLEIHIKHENNYISDEHKNVLGRKVKWILYSSTSGQESTYFTAAAGGFIITKFMIKRDTNPELDPECFV